MSSPRSEFISGVKAEIPLLIGVVPFGMIYGAVALAEGITPVEAQGMSMIVFAGSAQFISTQLISAGVPGLVIVLTVGIVNLRHALYSASLAPHLQHLKPAWKGLLAYLLTDEAYAVSITHYQEDNNESRNEMIVKHELISYKHWYLLGAGLTLWCTWQISTGLGILLGAQVPESWSLNFTITLTFIALLVPSIKDKPSKVAAIVAGVTAVLAFSLEFNLGLIIASVVGIIVGVFVESR